MLDLNEIINELDKEIERLESLGKKELAESLKFEKKSYEYSLNCGNGRFTGKLYPQGMRQR